MCGFETVRELVEPGGAIVTDNVACYEDVLTPAGLLAALDGEDAPNDRTRFVADFYEHLDAADEFETYVLPLGEGLAISVKTS